MKNLNLSGMEQDQQFEAAAKYAGVSADVLRGMWRTESGQGTNMLSSAGARGHFQHMPATQATLEQRAGRSFNPDDFADSLTMAAEVMRENMQHFKGDVTKALKGYNAGWDQAKWNNDETNAYVGKVLGQDGNAASFNVRNPGKASMSIGDVWNTSAYELRNGVSAQTSGKVPAKHESDIVKALRDQAATEAAAAALVAGDNPTDAALAQRVGVDGKERIPVLHARTEATPGLAFDNTKSWAEGLARQTEAEKRQAAAESVTFGDKFGASIDQNTLTAAILKGMDRPTYNRDPQFRVLDHTADLMEFAKNEDELDWQMEARSAEHLEAIRSEIQNDRFAQQTMGANSGMWGMAGYSVLGSIMDPAGFVAGFGVGKAFQIVGAGSRAAFAAGNAGRGFSYAAGEGALGNVLGTAVMDAAGSHMTVADYGMAAGSGLILSAGFGAFDWAGNSGKAAAAQLQQLGTTIHNNAVNEAGLLYNEAIGNLGPSATPDQIKLEVDRLGSIREERVMSAILGNARDEEMIMPRTDPATAAAFRQQFTGQATVVPTNLPGAILTNPTDRAALTKKYGLDLTIEDDAERLLAAEQYARAERFLAANPVDKARAKTVLAQAGMESTAARMLMSDNPLMQFAASVLLESASGAQGGARRVTAAITAKSKERLYMGNTLREFETLATTHRSQSGGNFLTDWANGGKKRAEFDALVYAERDRRLNGHPETQDPVIKRAADILDETYERMRKDQKHAGTLGSARLSDTAVRGFTHRQWKSGVLRSLDSGAYRAFQGEAARQFELISGYDNAFAVKFSREYANIARRRASASYDIPANLHDDANADMIRNALKEMQATDMQIEDLMGKFARGGASHTKARIDLDLTQTYSDSAGNSYRLMDYIDTDNMSLLRNYSRRTAGEVALAKYGIMGEPGLAELRLAIESGMDKSQASNKALEAFDQVAAEFLGKPFGQHLGKWADNARILTSAIRLGGMGITQLGEFTNAIAAVGISGAMKNVAGMPRLFKEVRAKAGGQKGGGILESIEVYTGELGMDGYRMQGLYDVNDGFDVYGKETLDRFSKAARASNHAVRIMSLHRDVNAVQVRGMSEQIVLKALRFIRDGGEDRALTDMGIGPDLIASMQKELSTIAKFDAKGGVTYLDLTKAGDQVAANEFAQAVTRGASQIIQDTFIGETGKWAHNDLLKILTQFRTFSLTSVEKQWGRQLSVHGGARMIGYTVGAMSIALPIHLARVQAKALLMDDDKREAYLERNTSPLALARATMNYISVLGILPDLLDAPMALAGYSVGGRGSQGVDSFLGGSVAPSIGVVNDVVQAATAHDPIKAAKLLPGASIPHFAWMINLLDDAASD